MPMKKKNSSSLVAHPIMRFLCETRFSNFTSCKTCRPEWQTNSVTLTAFLADLPKSLNISLATMRKIDVQGALETLATISHRRNRGKMMRRFEPSAWHRYKLWYYSNIFFELSQVLFLIIASILANNVTSNRSL